MISAPTVEETGRLPLVIYVLAVGVFLMGTTEFVVAGILPEIAGDLGTSIANVGLMITVFAIGMIVGTPAMAILTLRVPPRRVTLSSALIVFAIGHVIVALSSNFGLILAPASSQPWRRAPSGQSLQWSEQKRQARRLPRARSASSWAEACSRTSSVFRSALWPVRASGGVVLSGPSPPSHSPPRPSSTDWYPPTPNPVRCRPGERRSRATGRTHLARSVRLRRRVRVVAGGVQLHLSAVDREHGTCCVGSAASACRLRTRCVRRLQSRRSTRCEASVRGGLVRLGSDDVSRARGGALPLLAQRDRDGVSRSHAGTIRHVDQSHPDRDGCALCRSAPTMASALSTSSFNLGTAVGSWIAGFAFASSLGATGPVLVGTGVAALYFLPLMILLRKERTKRTAVEVVN